MTFHITAEHKFQLAQWAHGLSDFRLAEVQAQLACAFAYCRPGVDNENLIRVFQVRQASIKQEIENRGGIPSFNIFCAPWHKEKYEPQTWTLTDFSTLPDNQAIEQPQEPVSGITHVDEDITMHTALSPALDISTTDSSWLDDFIAATYAESDLPNADETPICSWLDNIPEVNLSDSPEISTMPPLETTRPRLAWEAECAHRISECDFSQLPIVSSYTETLSPSNSVNELVVPSSRRHTANRAQQARTQYNIKPRSNLIKKCKSRRRTRMRQDLSLTQPLSTMSCGKVADMMAWVTRPASQRHQELIKRNGKIPRAMNSFMLYRSAYKERIDAWTASANNYQVINSVAGESWAIESDEIKDFYTECAKVENANHQAAFPDYKYKPKKRSYSRVDDGDEEDDDVSEMVSLTISEDEYRPARKRTRRH